MRTIFIGYFKDALSNIPWDGLTETNYEFAISAFFNQYPITEAYIEAYYQIGLAHGNRVGGTINKEAKFFRFATFPEEFRRFLQQWAVNNLGKKIQSVSNGLVSHIVQLIANDLAAGTPLRETVRKVRNTVNSPSFYTWQAERIARTETTAAANLGAMRAAIESGAEFDKEWISTVDSRTRRRPPKEYDHVEMDGVTVAHNEMFNVNGNLISYPGDPRGTAGNIIQCRCTIAVILKRDAQGRIIFKN